MPCGSHVAACRALILKSRDSWSEMDVSFLLECLRNTHHEAEGQRLRRQSLLGNVSLSGAQDVDPPPPTLGSTLYSLQTGNCVPSCIMMTECQPAPSLAPITPLATPSSHALAPPRLPGGLPGNMPDDGSSLPEDMASCTAGATLRLLGDCLAAGVLPSAPGCRCSRCLAPASSGVQCRSPEPDVLLYAAVATTSPGDEAEQKRSRCWTAAG